MEIGLFWWNSSISNRLRVLNLVASIYKVTCVVYKMCIKCQCQLNLHLCSPSVCWTLWPFSVPSIFVTSWTFAVFIFALMHMSLVCICKIVIWKALREGDEMMNTGRLKQALPYYEKVMDAVDFKVLLCYTYKKSYWIYWVDVHSISVVESFVNCWFLVRIWTFNKDGMMTEGLDPI